MRSIAFGLGLFVLAGSVAHAASPDDTTGEWLRGDGNAKVRIEPCGEHLCATNIWVKEGRKDEAVGDVLVMMVKPEAGNRMVGKAFDKRRNLTYAMEIKVEESRLTSRGCMIGGILCKSMGWSRSK